MELPELSRDLVRYLSLYELHSFRLVSKDYCEYAKAYEGDPAEFVMPYSLKLCLHCYPNLKRLNTEYCFVECTDFESFTRLEELSIDINYLVRDTLFVPCVQLKKLYLSSNYFHQGRNLDSTFKYLPQLTALTLCNVHKVTNTAFHFSNQIEVLDISRQSFITSFGIQQLKNLKKLSIDTYNHGQSSLIRDDAFESLPIEELILHHQDFITDRGICHLKQLRKIVCVKVPRIQGEGWSTLKKIETIGLGQMTLYTVSNFKCAKTLSFQDATIHGPWRGLWLKLEKLRIFSCKVECLGSIKTIMCPRLQKIRIHHCPGMNEHEANLCRAFGPKLMFRC